MSVVIVAEKPSVGRDIAKALGAHQQGQGYCEGDGVVVTWAIGHLVRLAEPHEIQEAWKTWRKSDLPLLPEHWPVKVQDAVRDQFAVVKRLMSRKETSKIVCATDAGREGELIFRYIYEKVACKKPVERLWISSLTQNAIRDGFKSLKPASAFDDLADAAVGRSRADWLVGMNLSRACSLHFGGSLPIGRVQTPTLAMLVAREVAIRAFQPDDYKEIKATFQTDQEETYEGTWLRPKDPKAKADVTLSERKRLSAKDAEADTIVEEVRAGKASVDSVVAKDVKQPPPLLYDLTELQRRANRLFGLSAKDTLSVAQSLYEKHKLITYPRTDSKYLSEDMAKTVHDVVTVIAPRYAGPVADTCQGPLPKRFVSDDKVTDHHAIIPTAVDPQTKRLNENEEKIYDLICRRLLAAWHDDHVTAQTTIRTLVTGKAAQAFAHEFHSFGTQIRQQGWKAIDDLPRRTNRKDPAGESKLPLLKEKEDVRVEDVVAVEKQTTPPLPYNEATLLTAMETAGRTLDDKKLSAAMRERGLGTPATRAAIIEGLLKRAFVVREKKNLRATDKAIALIDVVPESIKSPRLTGEWEAMLRQIERGEYKLKAFMVAVEAFVKEQIAALFSQASSLGPKESSQPQMRQNASSTVSQPVPVPKAPVVTGKGMRELLQERFSIERFRPHQEDVCRAVASGKNALLVMPTGAGKSLCYQLPALMREGVGVVISPLIALMDDQVSKLKALGIKAERIHSGCPREESRAIMRRYHERDLDLLYVAPERLGLPGFMEFLASTPPSLIAIDEAHCISHWGHDFRPDYRALGERLRRLAGVPIVAVTATATPLVQDDIIEQLRLPSVERFIRGFRRHNIAIEIVNTTPSERMSFVSKIFSDKENRPGIVYHPSRQKAEDTAKALRKKKIKAAPYHAGMAADERERVQRRYLGGELDVICATVAFGMGVDKADIRTVVHMGLPSSVEAYYQEIGRAGRDGNVSRAIMLCSWADRKTQEFLIQKSYPEAPVLQKIYRRLKADPQPVEEVLSKIKVEERERSNALDKLLVHGGASVRNDQVVLGPNTKWKVSYEAQRKHRMAMLDHLWRFTAETSCRMKCLVQHFGDSADSGSACGLCDECAPDSCLVREFRSITDDDKSQMEAILQSIGRSRTVSVGQLFKQCSTSHYSRSEFDALLAELDRHGLVRISEDHFVKNGRRIDYQKVALTVAGRGGLAAAPELS